VDLIDGGCHGATTILQLVYRALALKALRDEQEQELCGGLGEEYSKEVK